MVISNLLKCKEKLLMYMKNLIWTVLYLRDIKLLHWRHLADKQQLRQQSAVNFLAPYQERFAVFKQLLRKFCSSCDVTLDSVVGAGLCVATDIASRAGHVDVDDCRLSNIDSLQCPDDDHRLSNIDKRYDFYNDAHVGESRQCLSLLRSLQDRVGELLTDWPDHPTLNQIQVLVERILSFDASSAVARFLTGLELVLTKVREWEENAHSGVSLANHMSAMVRQVIAWRKLELSCWKGCLFATRNRLKGEVSKWWFYLYALVAAFVKTKSSPSTEEEAGTEERVGECELVKALQSFMEKSTLVEFGPRLELLLTFHCHCSNMTEPGHCEATSIFWNCYCYYKQFEAAVERRIKELGAGVEKKLADFVKIARWNEITYWSVKETVQKTHRTLHKYIKEYESVLNESVLGALVKLDFPSENKKKLSDVRLNLNLAHYVTVNPVKPINDFGLEVFIMGAEMSILKKACKFSKMTIQKMRYAQLIGVVDDLVGEIVKTTRELTDLEVDRSLTKEKQRSQAKSYLQQKRKALTDLFRVLADVGLSYRTGLVVCPDESTVLEEQFVVAPLNVEVALQQIDSRDADEDIVAVWSRDGEKHFWHAVARLAQLKKTLRKPHKEIGPPIIERCKGFTNHLMKITVDEKKRLTESVTYLYQMRCYTKLLAKDVHYSDHIQSEILIHCQFELLKLLNDCVYCLEQFKVLLNACPAERTSVAEEDTAPLTNTLLDVSLLGPMILAHKGDNVWSSVWEKLNQQIDVAKSVVDCIGRTNRFEKFSETLKRTNPTVLGEETGSNLPSFLTSDKFTALKESVPKVSKLVADLNEIRSMFDLKVVSEGSKNPFVDFLSGLTEKIQIALDKIVGITETDQPSVPSAKEQLKLINKQTMEEFANKTDDCTSSILIAIQELYKKYGRPSDSDGVAAKKSTAPEEVDQSEESSLEENHLKSKVVENIGEDVAKLNLAAVTNCIEELLEELALMEGHDRIACKSLLERCCPLFDQYLLLAQFIITHQLSAFRVSSKLCSVLSALFVNLSQKGFCTPEDLADDLEQEGESEAKGGMGLGEGEGQKDVSDQIESEDQLEDARPRGEEREEQEEKDCKEEEKGIEMSEDFGGKLQDLEKKEGEEGEEEEEEKDEGEEEPDKEMGETEKGAETLDQEIWGSDSEEEGEEGDESEKKEEQGDKGEQTGEKEWGAKEDGKEPTTGDDDKKKDGDNDDEKEEINEMEEKEGDDNQVDPYHNKNQQQAEPEEFDLPEDLNLDDGEAKDENEEGDEEGDKENPFDIDAMKDVDEGRGEDEDDEGKKDEDKNEGDEEEEDGGGNEELKMNLDEEEEEEEEKNVDEGGNKDEKKTGEEETEKTVDERLDEEQAKPSDDAPAVEQTESAQEAAGSKDEVASSREQTGDDGEKDAGVSEGPDQEGVGHAEQDEAAVGHGGAAKQTQREPQASTGRDEKRQRPGESDDQHTLGDLEEPVKKKVKTVDSKEDGGGREKEEEEREDEEKVEESEMYQHVTDATKSRQDVEVVDAATKEQFEKQQVAGNDVQDKMEEQEEEEEDVICLDDDDDDVEMITDELPTESTKSEQKEKKDEGSKKKTEGKDLIEMTENKMETDGDLVETAGVERGGESTFHTRLEALESVGGGAGVVAMRRDVEEQLRVWQQQPPAADEAAHVWVGLSGLVTPLAAELSEQLRLVLEPTSASRLKGDFRTGRRINMRKVIPYIASQFRKDKIWLRRTKPSKRDYQVVLAMDDSSSMSDNHSKELAFESLALVSKALTLLEVGQLSVLSFGEKPKVLHPLSEPFTEQSGAKLMQQLLFDQQKTQVGSLMEFACDMLLEAATGRTGGGAVAQLLVIVSDGRGVLDEGEARVKAAVRRARLQNVFTVFVVIDNPTNKDSILDIRMPKFVDGKLLGISSYMDSFPFPFYLILRDINGLPMVLSDALRQWFELVTNLV